MIPFVESLTWIETVYLASAVVGGLLFFLRMLLFLFAGGIGENLEAFDADTPDGDAFPALSLQSISAFFMMFGLVGLTLYSLDVHLVWVILGSLVAALFSVWVIGILFTAMRRLQSSGNIKIDSAVGAVGTVYLTIPAGKTGQVSISVQGSLRTYDAVSKDGKQIKTGETIQVVAVVGTRTLVVQKQTY